MAFFDVPLRSIAAPFNPLRALIGFLRPGRRSDPIADMQARVRREDARLAADRLLRNARGPF